MKKSKPELSFWQIWNLSFGFLGVQTGYALQNANTSRILQSLGADVHELSYFWLAAPVAGLVVQPLVGLFSDRTWTRLGRRIPFILGGAILSTLCLCLMPGAELFVAVMPPLLFAAIIFLFMDMSFNVTMQPFRALVADKLNDPQKTKGYSIQSFLINCGAILGSLLPFALVHVFGLSNSSTAESRVPQSVAWSYYAGGAILLLTVLWTAFRTREDPPEVFASYDSADAPKTPKPKFTYLLAHTPRVMLQLGVVQFFSWAALFLMWTYSTPAVAANLFGATDTVSTGYAVAGDWVGVLFAAYAVFAGVFSMVIPRLSARIGNKNVYAASLVLGAAGFVGMALLRSQWMLLLPMIGIGVAWGAILAVPYSILAKALDPRSTGLYMGIFNFTITIPQIVMGLLGGVVVRYVFHGNAVAMLLSAGALMLLAAVSVSIVRENHTQRI